MTSNLKNIEISLLLLIMMMGIESCIHEDNSDCIRGVYIYFKPENNKHNYPELVRTVNLYFYDETGNLIVQSKYSKEELHTSDRAAFVENLPQGNYTLISIINQVETYLTTSEQQLTTLQTQLRDKMIDTPLVDFFSGNKEITVNHHPLQQKIITDIFKHNNDIEVEIVFDGYEPPPQTTITTYIEGNNGAYHYHSATSPKNNVVKYLPHRIEADNNYIPLIHHFTIMRLWRKSDMTLYLQEENPFLEVTHSIKLNIADELAKVVNEHNEPLYDTDQKLSFNDEYKIVITLGADFVILQLTINDWTVIGGGIEV